MKIAIVDDSKKDRLTLDETVRKAFSEQGYILASVDMFDSGEALLKNFKAGIYDLIFLDIYMDDIDGIETAEKIRQTDIDVKIVFTTSSNDFASESYGVGADYYLLKPYSDKDFSNAIERLKLSDFHKKRMIKLPDGQQILLRAISYTSFSGHYVTIHRRSGKIMNVRCTQSSFENLILHHSGFVVCTKGMTVNLNEVEKLEKDHFVMKNGAFIPVSRRNYQNVKNSYSDFLIRKIREGTVQN